MVLHFDISTYLALTLYKTLWHHSDVDHALFHTDKSGTLLT